jgi:hypothetical protein
MVSKASMGPHQRKDQGDGAWFGSLSLVEGAALFDCGGGEVVRSRAQKPLEGFLIHPTSRGERYPPPTMAARHWEDA